MWRWAGDRWGEERIATGLGMLISRIFQGDFLHVGEHWVFPFSGKRRCLFKRQVDFVLLIYGSSVCEIWWLLLPFSYMYYYREQDDFLIFLFFFASGVYEMTVRKYQTIVTHFYMIFPHMNRREDDYFGFHIYAILHSKV